MISSKIRAFNKKVWGILGRVSLRTKIFGIVIGSALLLSIPIIYQGRNTLHNILEQKSHEQGISIARDVAARRDITQILSMFL